ncbi:hypothetical protein MRB53_031490 [Persea americana]|uniref:Uncharacterized protein n=1 Tax=Persea americana TaxID=3435 RepID=A0ACC2KP52_PERAE|nr:hypothetical protein MRB53_031490 [Persea americana]
MVDIRFNNGEAIWASGSKRTVPEFFFHVNGAGVTQRRLRFFSGNGGDGGGSGEESGDRRRRDGSVQQHNVHVNRALPAIFFLSGSCAGVQQHSDASSAVLAIFFSGETRSPLLLSSPVTARRREQQKSGPLSSTSDTSLL